MQSMITTLNALIKLEAQQLIEIAHNADNYSSPSLGVSNLSFKIELIRHLKEEIDRVSA